MQPDRTAGVNAWDRLFIECDSQGEILWMNESARARLGPARNLLDAVPSSQVASAWQLLRGRAFGDQPSLTCLFGTSEGAAAVPVRFERWLATDRKVVLAARVRGRTADAHPGDEGLGLLQEMQRTTTRNYFRLLEARRSLEKHRRGETRPVGARIAEALETERTRVARDLHSGVGQTLAGIRMNLDMIDSLLANPPEAVRACLARIQKLAEQSMDEVRSISRRLHPPDWQRLKLVDALELLWKTTGIPDRFHATLDLRRLTVEPSHAVRVALYRAAQEGLSNLLRHADATEVRLALDQEGDKVHLILEDNGNGFDTRSVFGAPAASVRGIGLRALREEVQALEGEWDLASGPGGTRMEIRLPLAEE